MYEVLYLGWTLPHIVPIFPARILTGRTWFDTNLQQRACSVRAVDMTATHSTCAQPKVILKLGQLHAFCLKMKFFGSRLQRICVFRSHNAMRPSQANAFEPHATHSRDESYRALSPIVLRQWSKDTSTHAVLRYESFR